MTTTLCQSLTRKVLVAPEVTSRDHQNQYKYYDLQQSRLNCHLHTVRMASEQFCSYSTYFKGNLNWIIHRIPSTGSDLMAHSLNSYDIETFLTDQTSRQTVSFDKVMSALCITSLRQVLSSLVDLSHISPLTMWPHQDMNNSSAIC